VSYTPEELQLLAKCGWLEGRDGGAESMRAVMHVVMNRVNSRNFPKTIQSVIMQPLAFSWTMPENPEYGRDPAASKGADLEAWHTALDLAAKVLAGDPSNVANACYYEAPGATSGWFKRVIAGDDLMGTDDHKFATEVGGQRYYL
jgi:spore germination cell wall hydrolase CwlJ-like protein